MINPPELKPNEFAPFGCIWPQYFEPYDPSKKFKLIKTAHYSTRQQPKNEIDLNSE